MSRMQLKPIAERIPRALFVGMVHRVTATLRLQILGDLRKRIPIPPMEVCCGREEGSFIEGP